MPTKEWDIYKLHRKIGVEKTEAEMLAGVPAGMGAIYESAVENEEPNRMLQAVTADHAYKGTSEEDQQRVSDFLDNRGLTPEAGAPDYPELTAGADDDIDLERGFWGNVLDFTFNSLDTLGASQQALYRSMTGDDLRKAIPDYMKPEHVEKRWDEEDLAHEMIFFDDVVNDWTNGGYQSMMEDLNEGNWFTKWALGGGIKVAGFVADVALDPMTYLAGLGIGTKLINKSRSLLPAAVRSEHLGKIAGYRRSIENYNNYIASRKEHITELVEKARLSGDPKHQGQVLEATAELKDAIKAKEMLVADTLDGRGVSMQADRLVAKPKKGASDMEKELYKARHVALKRNPSMVDFNDLPKREYTFRMVAGPDDAEILNEGLSGIIRGADVHDVRVKKLFTAVDPAHTSTSIPMNGVSSKGLITDELMQSKAIFNDVTHAHAIARVEQKDLKQQLNALKRTNAKNRTPAQKAEIVKVTAKLDEVTTRATGSQGHIDHFKATGRFPDSVLKANNIELPWGPRKPILRAGQFDDTLGTRTANFFAKGLYPQSTVARTGWLAKDIMFREPMRVMERHMPGTWDFMRGKMKTAEYHQVSLHKQFSEIFEKHGIHNMNKVVKKAGDITGVPVPSKLKINKANDRAMWDLLNNAKHTENWNKAMTAHGLTLDSPVVKAHDEVRAILNDIGKNKLNLSEDMFLDGYITHVINPVDFKNGAVPWEFQGSRSMGGVPWFMKERVGDFGENVGITEALDAYSRGVTNFLYTKPMLAEMDNQIVAYGLKNGKNKENMDKFWGMLRENVTGAPSHLGKLLDMLPGGLQKGTRRTASAIGALTYSAALTGNPRYLVMSLAQNINTTAAEFGALRSLKGVAKMFTQEGRQAARMAGLATEHARIMDGISSSFSKMASDVRVLAPSITDTEFLIRGVTFHASIDAQLTKMGVKSLDDIAEVGVRREIVAQSMKDSESINHVFGAIGKPVWMSRVSRSGSALATQFTTFPFKQTETLYEHTQKNPGFLWDYLVIAGQTVRYGHHANVELSDYVGLGYSKAFMVQHDVTSMPVDTMLAVLGAGKALSMDATQLDRDTAVQDIKDAASNMVPFRAVVRAFTSAKGKMIDGEVRNSKTGQFIRESNTSLLDDRTGHQNEAVSSWLGLKSIQDEIENEVRNTQFKTRSEAKGHKDQLVRSIRDSLRKGEPVSSDKIAQISKELDRMGISFTDDQLNRMVSTQEGLINLQNYMRDVYDNDPLSYDVRKRVEHRSHFSSHKSNQRR